MRGFLTLLLFAVAACGGPSPHFRGSAPVRVAVDGSVFDVRRRGNLAEAVRLNSEYAPRLGPLRGRARAAMAQATGCGVQGVLGDQALMVGILDCSGE